MAVAKPQILMAMLNTSGTTCTNDGTVATNGTISGFGGSTVENTNFSWNAGPPRYLRFITPTNGTAKPWVDMTGIAMPTTNEQSLWVALKFRVSAFANSRGYFNGTTNSDGITGGPSIRLHGPTSNDFDLTCRFANGSQYASPQEFPSLLFNTDYAIVMSLDTTVPSAAIPKYKLDAAAVVTGSSVSVVASGAYNAEAGFLNSSGEFSGQYYGNIGFMYYYCQGRGVFLSDAEMASINSDITTAVTGWPGVSTGGGNLLGNLVGGTLVGGMLVR